MPLVLSAATLRSKYEPQKSRYPLCVAWTPLPCISWLLPFIGHTGICTSDGRVHDFAGPYTIGVRDAAAAEAAVADAVSCRWMKWLSETQSRCAWLMMLLLMLLDDRCVVSKR